jgi:hypothetical protein
LNGCTRRRRPDGLRPTKVNQDHGAETVPNSGGQTYHELAVEVAESHTSSLYAMVRARIETSVSPATHDVSGPCRARKLFQTSALLPCADISGIWRVSRNDALTGLPPLGQVWSLAQGTPWDLTGTIASVVGGALTFSAGRVSATLPFEGTALSCPAAGRLGACPAQVALPVSLTFAGSAWIRGKLTAIVLEETQSECREVERIVQPFELRRSS